MSDDLLLFLRCMMMGAAALLLLTAADLRREVDHWPGIGWVKRFVALLVATLPLLLLASAFAWFSLRH